MKRINICPLGNQSVMEWMESSSLLHDRWWRTSVLAITAKLSSSSDWMKVILFLSRIAFTSSPLFFPFFFFFFNFTFTVFNKLPTPAIVYMNTAWPYSGLHLSSLIWGGLFLFFFPFNSLKWPSYYFLWNTDMKKKSIHAMYVFLFLR